jgi:hypothetical protein
VVLNWWRQGMMGSVKAHYDGMAALSQTDFTPDLRKFTVPTLFLHGEDDQVVPIADSSPLAVKLVPYVVYGMLRTADAVSPIPAATNDRSTLAFAGVGICIVLPVVVLYLTLGYRVFRGKLPAPSTQPTESFPISSCKTRGHEADLHMS